MTRATPWLQVGFLPRRQRAPWPAWALLVCGMGLFMAAALDWREADTARADAEQALRTWETRERTERDQRDAQARQRRLAQASPASAASAKASPASRDTLRNAQRVAALLDHRWDQLFATLEANTPAGLQWLRLEHEAEAGEVQLEGLAAEGRLALQVVDTLATQVGWRDVAMSRLEAGAASGQGAEALRFELRARMALERP